MKMTKTLPTNCFEAWQRANPVKPELSSGTPEELTPNQIAERAASAALLKTIGGDEDIKRDNGWRLLAQHVGGFRKKGEVDEREFMSPEHVQRWSEGWKAGCYDEDVDCPDCSPEEQRLWLAGLADGTKALMLLEKDEAVRRGTIARKGEEVTDLAEMERIWKAHKKNGGKYKSYEAIEADKSFGLKWANGMTAWRIIKKYEKILRNKKIAA